MNSKIAICCLIIFMLISNVSLSYDDLRVGDPRQSWSTYRGTIEQAIISIRPQGIYMEIGLYLTFSARGSYFGANDSLEITLNFDLPEEAIVHDSWLWVGDDIVRAQIMDKWTASSIYENIVRRRRDPSILFKKYQGHYELRIFPMAGNETRKVKLTYLVPTTWSSSAVSAQLPTNILRTSRYSISPLYVLTWAENEWSNPRLLEYTDVSFEKLYDPAFGNYYRADLPDVSTLVSLNFAVDSPLKNGVYLNTFGNENQGIYQIAFLPSQLLDIAVPLKSVLLFDYDASNTYHSVDEMLNVSKNLLHSTFTDQDSFNLIFSKLDIIRASELWLPADSLTIENTFADISENSIASYSNMPSLISNGIHFVKTNSNDGSLLLISSSDQYGDYQTANQLIDDLLDLMDPELPVHVADFANKNYNYNYFGGKSYLGNEYFFSNISRLTKGNYFNIRNDNQAFTELMSLAFQSLSGFISSFDLHTKLQNGFCYSRFSFASDGQSAYLNKPILQVGKYNGTFPFIVETAGIFNSEPFAQNIKIEENIVFEADTLAEEIWVGNYIISLEESEQANDVVNEIIDLSVSERVLSLYTAFLALEPNDTIPVCYNCLDESDLVSAIKESDLIDDSTYIFKAFPNPFNSQTTINFNLKGDVDLKNVTFKLYNLMGQVVRSFIPTEMQDKKQYQFLWDGTNDNGTLVSSGNYFFIVSTPNNRHTLKLTLLK